MIDIALLTFLVMVAVAIVRVRNLLAVTMLTGIYSLIAAMLFVLLDAVDVALTEAAVGAGLLVILMLGTIALTARKEKVRATGHNMIALFVVAVTGAALIYGTSDMPNYGDPLAPAHVHLSPRFTQDSPTEIGIPNMVTSVLASYRGLDTFGEALVIFAAGVGVLLLLGTGKARPSSGFNGSGQRSASGMSHYIVLRVISRLMIPVILIFALYVQFHGEYSPGGGFQAGIVFSAAFIVYTMLYGLAAAQQAFPPIATHIFAAVGVLLYASIGFASLLLGGNFLEYKVLLPNAQAGETLGIIGIELGVGITVASVALSLFYSFAGREQEPR